MCVTFMSMSDVYVGYGRCTTQAVFHVQVAIISETEKEAQARARHAQQLQEDQQTIANHASRYAQSFSFRLQHS